MAEELSKHLELIQGVVERHARNSFLLKGWSVTLVAAIFLLALRGAEPLLALAVGLLPALTFWGLDAFYLRQERMYRCLYESVRKGHSGEEAPFSLDARPYADKVPSWWGTLPSATVIWFHAAVVAAIVGGLVLLSLWGIANGS